MTPRWGQSVTQNIFGRETRLHGARGTATSLIQRDLLSHIGFEANSVSVPLPPATETDGLPMVVKFNQNPSYNNCQLLAIGGEEGFVTIANTENLDALQTGVLDGSWRPRAHWPCHRNSIFDLAWAKNDAVIYTASGHQQVGIWDTDTARGLAVAEGHEGSVKAVAPLTMCEDIFATGSRDGRIMLWDARCPGFSGQAPAAGRRALAGTGLDGVSALSPVWVQEGAHTLAAAATARRSSKKIAKPAPVTVTSVAFVPHSYLLASGGAQDTVVKLWDLRMHGLPMCDLELPPAVVHGTGGRGGKGKAADGAAKSLPHEVAAHTCPTQASAVGVTHITVSGSGVFLLASCLDSQHHLFSLSRLHTGPVVSWRAPPPAGKASFYMRSAFSPCGDYVLCGSRDCGAHIWSVDKPQQEPISLPHEHEVTGVSWSAGDWAKVATCSDSGEAKVWTLSRLPARRSAAGADEGPAVVAAVSAAALEVDGKRTDSAAGEHVGEQPADIPCADGWVLQPSPHIAAYSTKLPPTPATDKPASRRTVQSVGKRMESSPRATPVPAKPAPAPQSTPGNANEGPSKACPSPAAREDEVAGLPDRGVSARSLLDSQSALQETAAAIHASALRSPVAAMPRVLPLPSPASARRRGALPPVPIFSPAINLWQLRQPSDMPAHGTGTAAPAGAAPSALPPEPLPSTACCGGLEEAMRGLAQVRTQSPARLPQRDDVRNQAAGSARRVQAPDVASQQQQQEPLQLPQANSFPPSSSAQPAVRAPAISPHATPGNFFRSRSRLGLFSPSQSSHSSGSGPFSGSGSSGGGAGGGDSGTPRHHPPQGVVAQIIRNSPRPGSARADMSARSPHVRRASLEGCIRHSDSPVQRRLFPVVEQDEGRVGEGGEEPDGFAHVSSLADWRLQGGRGPNIIADVARLLQHSDDVAMALPYRYALPPRLPSSFVPAFEVDDGQDVGPALRYRALHPEHSGHFDNGLAGGMALPGSDQHPDAENAPAPGSVLPAEFFALGGRSAFAEGLGFGADENEVWALRRVANNNGCLFGDSDDESDWEFDPYGDKENTPPPEPLEGPTPSLPRSSASGGGSGSTGPSTSVTSPRLLPSADLPLPLLLLDPAPSVEQQLPPSDAPRLVSAFAAAAQPPLPAYGSGSSSQEAFAAEPASSLHTEPTMSDGIAPIGERRACSSGGGLEGGAPDGMRTLGRDYSTGYRSRSGSRERASGSGHEADEVHHATGRHNHPSGDVEDGYTGGVGSGAGGGAFEMLGGSDEARQHADNPTPTKRARRTYDYGSPSDDRSLLSPTRRARPYDKPPIPFPTPGSKLRSSVYHAGVMASPCVRGSLSRGAGGSRLAPAARAGLLMSGADAIASAGIGSESPAPKVGTASRTGRRSTPAAKEFFRKRAEEDREGAMMSPFGFGQLVSSSLAAGAGPVVVAPASAHRGPSRLVKRGATPVERTSPGRLLLGMEEQSAEEKREEGAGGDDGGSGLEAELTEEEEMQTIEATTRSLSCIFETQTQNAGTVVVPGTNPTDYYDNDDNDESRHLHHRMGAASGVEEPSSPRPLSRELWPSAEERTVASPPMFGGIAAATADGGLATQQHVGESAGQQAAGCHNHRTDGDTNFGSLFWHAGHQHPQHDHLAQQQPAAGGAGPSTVALPAIPPLPLDESSRCFPVEDFRVSTVRPSSSQQQRRDSDADSEAQQGAHVSLSQRADSGELSDSAPVRHPSMQQSPGGPLDAPLPQHEVNPLLAAEAGFFPADGPSGLDRAGEAAGRKHVARQQTLKQCWGFAPIAAHPQLLPLGQKVGAGMPPTSGHRALGPTGLTSPRYFR